jgi:aspartyl-tRNA(Asn)/glutamyl-tRNA(Gln) amidotransferase subunit B
VASVKAQLPELPEARKARFVSEYALTPYDADVIVRLPDAADYFEAMIRAGAPPKAAGNWVQGELRRKMKDEGIEDVRQAPIGPTALAELVVLADQGVISSSVAKDVFEKMWTGGRAAREIVEQEGLGQIADEGALSAIVADVIAKNPGPAEQYRAGRTATLGFLVGQVMKASDGKANPKVVNELLRKALG